MSWQHLLQAALRHQSQCALLAALLICGCAWLRVTWDYGRNQRTQAPLRWYMAYQPPAEIPAGEWDLQELHREFPQDKQKLKEWKPSSEQTGQT